ncbi:unnamed protein product [Caenorhabditis sp. 36 PRJEB53466]|nr:unnamed protein product [Caenorhabditis sp. 36 PRJEB53466]
MKSFIGRLWKKMYGRLKSSLLHHFQRNGNNAPTTSTINLNGLSREEKKRLRHSLAECQLNEISEYEGPAQSSSSPASFSSALHYQPRPSRASHAPLAPQEEYLDESSSTLYSDLLATSFSNTSANSSSFVCDYEDPNDPLIIMPSPALSWNVQYVGSFPISNSHINDLGNRVDNYQGAATLQNVELSISVLGVRITCEKTSLMSHSLRRITDVTARPHTANIGYVATEPVGRTYRRLCHVFHCHNMKEAEEIENVLRNANRSDVLTSCSASSQKIATASTSAMHPTSCASTMTEKRSASTVFLNRFLGKKGSQTVDEGGQCKRKRRPVSAVFSSAIHRLSSSTSSVNPKRMSTIEPSTPTKEQLLHLQKQMRCASPVPEEPRPSELCSIGSTTTSTSSVASSSSVSSNGTSPSTATSPVPPPPQSALVFDDKLGEWIYPIDSAITAQLDNCSYFVGMPSRDSLAYNLLSQPEGAFVIRYSESKSKCLALSMRVPVTHNPSGISHYLIIRNEHGFRLKLSATKKPFPTLQMMLTHHSVLEGHLPCTLHFVQWQKTNFKQLPPVPPTTIDRPPRTFSRHSTALTKIDENRNVAMCSSTPTYRPSGRCGTIDEFATPKHRRSRHELNAMRRSHFFDDRQIVL